MRIYYFSRWKALGLGLLAAFVFWYFSHPVVLRRTALQVAVLLGQRIIPIYAVGTDEKKIAISFDATWGADQTPDLLRILRENQVRTTFFLCGLWVEKYPEMVKRIAAEGHEVGNHSYTHPHMNSLSEREIAHELNRTHHLIKELTGQSPTLFRPPFGEYNNKVIETARACGYTTIIWDVDSLDWKDLTAEAMLDRILKRIKPGSIVLFHNAGKNTPQALARLLPILKGQGFSIVPISELLHKGETYTDHTGRQFPKPRMEQSKPPEGGI
ncbi:MAG TPA: polysaccharide deacetylase family protein [Firmicutes bacterium]|uniref:Polysaccharide deacetylase family protein n=1 Tax=Capillibacterium thermochitinicola TaxID=2699427 RepID=A0A8J6I0S4_9FIRM|nr:polysaccharide deacetylase family protein [Capillibacterium thermochitinicola]MBA2133346.1 polysaccharide deacetylase family protein [Capillibacterium thermochitinicola]HHW11805.1 polysaccharide deacetylase family protein [Bacillota bacterium]